MLSPLLAAAPAVSYSGLLKLRVSPLSYRPSATWSFFWTRKYTEQLMTRTAATMQTMTIARVTPLDELPSLLLAESALDPPLPVVGDTVGDAVVGKAVAGARAVGSEVVGSRVAGAGVGAGVGTPVAAVGDTVALGDMVALSGVGDSVGHPSVIE